MRISLDLSGAVTLTVKAGSAAAVAGGEDSAEGVKFYARRNGMHFGGDF